MRDPDTIVAEAAKTLDFTRPVALTMMGIMGQLPDEDDPHAIVGRLLDALPPGSYLALSDGTDVNEALNQAISVYNANSASSYHLRPPEQITRFFDGLELVDPGVVAVPQWRPGPDPFDEATETEALSGLGRKR